MENESNFIGLSPFDYFLSKDDMEQHINHDYNLYEENPIFDNEDDANEFALKKNNELYPDKRNSFEKLIDTISNIVS